jgi:LPS-assembly protein
MIESCVQIYADLIEHQDSVLQAVGHVTLKHDDYVLKTSTLTYKDETAHAFFPLSIQDEKKNTLIAQRAVFHKNQRIVAKNIEVTFEDSSQFLGYVLNQTKKDHGVIKKGSYTACYQCRSNPTWIIKSKKINYDENDVVYRDAVLYINNFPVFYTPYFSHPHPKIKFRKGILMPNPGKDKKLGCYMRVPFYYPFNEHSDVEFTPVFSTKKRPILILSNTNFYENCNMSLGGSYADVSPKKRWHVSFATKIQINNNTKFLMKIKRASDITYLLGYPIEKNTSAILPNQQKNLTSNFLLEHMKKKHYTTINGYIFQTEKQSKTPRVVPYVTHDYHNHYGNLFFGSETSFVFLEKGSVFKRYQRLKSHLYVGHSKLFRGHVFKNTFSTKMDLYHINQKNKSKFLKSPLFQSSWSYPFIYANMITEPTAQMTLQNNNQERFVDGLRYEEIDAVNIFSAYRARSVDKIEKKTRFVKGVRQTFFHHLDQVTQLFLGKSFSFDKKMSDKQDYVSEFKTGQSQWNFSHKNSFTSHGFNYLETGVFIKKKSEMSLAHIVVKPLSRPINQVQWQIKVPVKNHWSLSFAQIHQLGPKKFLKQNRNLSQFLCLEYVDECFKARFGMHHNQYSDQDIKPNHGFMISLVFNNLGAYDLVSGPSYPESAIISKKL